MIAVYQELGRKFLRSDCAEREKMAAEFADAQKQQAIIDELFYGLPPYSSIDEFRAELAFAILVSRWFEPRDISGFIGAICDRVRGLSPHSVREVAHSMSELMDSTVRNTNLGTLSTRSQVLYQIDQYLKKLENPN